MSNEKPKTDWSLAEKVFSDMQTTNDTKVSPEPADTGNTTEIPGSKNEEMSQHVQAISQYEYKKLKRETAQSRAKNGILYSEEELRREDMKLRKKFGLE